MSMLTPPGMGGKYRITGDKYPRMRPTGGRRKLVLAATGGVLALGLVGWGTFQLVDVFTGGSTATAAGGKNCPAPATSVSPAKVTPLPAPGRIKVNVLNATERSGLAKATADALKKRGFAIGEVGNATEEYDKKVKGTVLLLGAADAVDGAFPVLATQVGGAKQKVEAPVKGEPAKADAAEGEGESDEAAKGPRKPNEVDLIIGDGFKKLAPEAAATGALKALNTPKPSPSPSSGGRC
ncbi:LytR C-terminal domain-containing protein [Streptomyces albidoflavus]|uniref:LytR C-terminal domain-containing protein n=1 Tax=Streptomyces albidoflavus TaxID=1886 RepID=UPI002149265D|nr:LytR C-terminal domain-containing protein [Streptomyces albidoflavus]MCR0989622.1 LytR C-terminal domain-containing protein [Streptomyces albidoflavus]